MARRTGFEYHLQRFPVADLAAFRPFFERMPLDPYIQGHFRRRRFSHFLGAPDRLQKLPHTYFEQARSINYLQGGIKRDFKELEDGLVALPAFRTVVKTFLDFVGLDPEREEYGVHQIRILCSPDFSGDPAPEGIHKDGFDFVGIFCIERDNVAGAATHLYRDKNSEPIFNRELQPGEVVFTNDRAVFHYTDPIHSSGSGAGHRDVFVITA